MAWLERLRLEAVSAHYARDGIGGSIRLPWAERKARIVIVICRAVRCRGNVQHWSHDVEMLFMDTIAAMGKVTS